MKFGHLKISELHRKIWKTRQASKFGKIVGDKIHKKKEFTLPSVFKSVTKMDISRLLPTTDKFQHEFWSGVMQWHQHKHHLKTNLNCTAWSTKPQFVGDVGLEWPTRLQLKLIPKVTTAGFMGIKTLIMDNVAQVLLLKFDDTGTADVDLMKLQMKYSCETTWSSPVFGLVQFGCTRKVSRHHHHHHHEDVENNDSDITDDCPIKFLLMIYVPVQDSFYGLIPANQDEFIDNLLAAMKQQQAANALLLLKTTCKF